MLRRVAVFLGTEAVAAALAWVGGFNFDQRNGDVAYAVFCAIVAGLLAASGPFYSEVKR